MGYFPIFHGYVSHNQRESEISVPDLFTIEFLVKSPIFSQGLDLL